MGPRGTRGLPPVKNVNPRNISDDITNPATSATRPSSETQ